MSDVIFVHKLHALTYLGKKRNKFSESSKGRVTMVTQQGMDKDWLVTRQLDNVEQACTMISWI